MYILYHYEWIKVPISITLLEYVFEDNCISISGTRKMLQ